MESPGPWVETTPLHQSRPSPPKGWKSIPGKRGLGRAALGVCPLQTPCPPPPFLLQFPRPRLDFSLGGGGGAWQRRSAPLRGAARHPQDPPAGHPQDIAPPPPPQDRAGGISAASGGFWRTPTAGAPGCAGPWSTPNSGLRGRKYRAPGATAIEPWGARGHPPTSPPPQFPQH